MKLLMQPFLFAFVYTLSTIWNLVVKSGKNRLFLPHYKPSWQD